MSETSVKYNSFYYTVFNLPYLSFFMYNTPKQPILVYSACLFSILKIIRFHFPQWWFAAKTLPNNLKNQGGI
jgi:hypothetical protein